MWNLVVVEVLQLDKEKTQVALIAIDDIWVFVNYRQDDASSVEAQIISW